MINTNNFEIFKKKLVYIIAIFASLFHLYVGWFGLSSVIYLRSPHLMLMSLLIFLMYPISRKKSYLLIFDLIFVVSIIIGCTYLIINYKYIVFNLGNPTNTQIILGILVIIVVLEATRRIIGNVIPSIAIISILYAYFGPYFGPLAHKAYSIQRIVSQLYLTTEGIFGTPLGVSANFILLFILFGSCIRAFGGGDFFFNFSSKIGRKRRSGPAITAVVESALFGTISGSAVANVSTTGNFTIPLMKKVGFKPSVAAAIEAVASTGGQLMPPIMGAAAFILSELTEVPYFTVIKRAFIPAVLYYFALACFVDLYAEKNKIKMVSQESLPDFKQLFQQSYTFIIPVAGLLYFLIKGYSPAKSAVVAILFTIIVAAFDKKFRQKGYFRLLIKVLEEGAQDTVLVALTCACAGIVIGMLNLTGLGLRISSFIINLSGGNLLIALFLVMITSIIMGMGLPTTAAYIIVAILGAPALIEMGIPVLSAHLFIFYFSVISCITPPIALAAYAAAGIAKSDTFETGYKAFYYGIVAYIIPFFFVYKPTILGIGNIFEILSSVIFIMIGILSLSIARERYFGKSLNFFTVFVFVIIAILSLYPTSLVINLTGAVLFIFISIYFLNNKKVIKLTKLYRRKDQFEN